MRTPNGPLRVAVATFGLVLGTACISLNYPEPDPPSSERASPARAEPANPARAERLPPRETSDEGVAKSWSELTRAARELRQRGELDAAAEKLEQAAIQVSPMAPSQVERQTVFGMRARLAEEYARRGDTEAADLLADELFAEAEAEPALGGAALASLAVSVADRREKAAAEEGEEASQLALYRLALDASAAGPSSRSRMDLAVRVADSALEADDLPLARRAIDRAIADAGHVIPARRARIAQLELLRARITLDAGDLEAAERSAARANAIFDEIDADPSTRAVAEAQMVEVLAAAGDFERADAIALGAAARMDLDPPLNPYAERRVLAAMARLERQRGDRAAARARFDQALAIPGVDFAPDRDLVRALTEERAATDEDASALAPDEDPSPNTELQ